MARRSLVGRPLFDRLEIVGDQRELWRRLIELSGSPPDQPNPKAGLAAGLVGETIVAVPPAVYRDEIETTYGTDREAWEKLVAHEMAHVLHVRWVGGDEGKMGPEWFYEGFAVLAADQKPPREERIDSWPLAADAVASKGPGSYAKYDGALRFFLRHTSLGELVMGAGEPGFEDWLRDLVSAPPAA